MKFDTHATANPTDRMKVLGKVKDFLAAVLAGKRG